MLYGGRPSIVVSLNDLLPLDDAIELLPLGCHGRTAVDGPDPLLQRGDLRTLIDRSGEPALGESLRTSVGELDVRGTL